jgi:hypothetical protein
MSSFDRLLSEWISSVEKRLCTALQCGEILHIHILLSLHFDIFILNIFTEKRMY